MTDLVRSGDVPLTRYVPASEVRALLVEDLQTHARRLAEAKRDYEAALWRARRFKMPNTVIARSVGLSEAAVRMFFKRNEEEARSE